MSGGGNVKSKFQDEKFTIFDSSDRTKKLVFEVNEISSDTTRTITIPDEDVDLGDMVQISGTLTDYAVVCGDGGDSGVQSVSGVGNTAQVLTSNGASALPTWQDLPNEFADNVFKIQDDGDASKEIAFQADQITTSTTRTITMLDADIDLANVVQASAALTDYAVVCGDGGVKGSQTIAGVGTSGQVLTSNGAGALPTFQAASAGYDVSDFSGGKSYVMEEFLATGNTQSLGWSVSTASGGGTGTKALSQHYGVVKMTRGSTAVGSAMWRLPNAFYPDLPFKFGFYIQIETLSDGTNRYDLELGVSNATTSSGAIADGLYFRFVDDENSGKWQIITEKDDTQTNSDSGITATTNWTYFEIEADASWTNISFYIDGVETSNSPITTNIPATTDFMYFFIRLIGSDGTTDREVYIDRFYLITNP